MNRKRIRTVALAMALAVAFAAQAFGEARTVVLHVPDMCASNEIQAQTVIEEIRGVSSVKTDMGAYTVTVSYDDEAASVESFKDALKGISLMVESVEGPE